MMLNPPLPPNLFLPPNLSPPPNQSVNLVVHPVVNALTNGDLVAMVTLKAKIRMKIVAVEGGFTSVVYRFNLLIPTNESV